MFDLSSWDVKGQALGALQDYARGPVVFLVDGPVGTLEIEKAKAGSGTLIRTPRGRTVVLTAKHNFEDLPPTGMSIGGEIGSVSNALGARLEHPSATVDLAVTMISADAEGMFGRLAVPADVVAATADTDFAKQNPMILCGYPAMYRRTIVQSKATALHEFACVSYATLVEPELDANSRYQARWKEGARTSADPVFPAIPAGETFDLVHPRGISGGPLWRFRSVGEGNLWSPSKMGQIIAVATDYNPEPDHLELCTSVAVWGDWFRETIAKIDAAS